MCGLFLPPAERLLISGVQRVFLSRLCVSWASGDGRRGALTAPRLVIKPKPVLVKQKMTL